MKLPETVLYYGKNEPLLEKNTAGRPIAVDL